MATVHRDASYMRALLERVDWSKKTPRLTVAGLSVYTHPKMDLGAVYVSSVPARRIAIISVETWLVLEQHPDALSLFLGTVRGGATGMRFLDMNQEPWRSAQRSFARASGTDVIAGKDPIRELTEDAQRLLLHAASINGSSQSADSAQTQLLMQEIGDLSARLEAEERRMEELRGLITTATLAALGVE